MYANNEIGTIEPIANIAKEVRHARKINKSIYPFLHTDASQAAHYLDINVLRLGVDLMTLSSQKTYGPRGVGALFVKRGVSLQPIIYGGKHEHSRRPGTESPALAQGFAVALLESRAMSARETKRVGTLRDLLARQLLKKIPGSTVNGSLEQSLPNMLSISIDGAEGDALVLYLDAKGIAVSGQSACKSSEDGPSHVIIAIGKMGKGDSGVIRFSLGRSTTREDIMRVISELPPIVSRLREMNVQGDQ
jgi:cysteine desulfurase